MIRHDLLTFIGKLLFPWPFMEVLFPYKNNITHATTAAISNFTILQLLF